MLTKERRSFSTEVIDKDRFLEMPPSARLLYYDLGVRADDEGFVEPLRVMRITGSSPDDLKILVGKGFVHVFDDGVIVILNWWQNNFIRSERVVFSQHHKRLKEIKKLGIFYTLPEPKSLSDSKRTPSRQPGAIIIHKSQVINPKKVSPKLPNGKTKVTYPERVNFSNELEYAEAVGVWNDRKVETIVYGNPEVNKVLEAWKQNFGIKPDGTIRDNRYAASRLIKSIGSEKTISSITYAASVRSERFAPNINSIRDLEMKLSQLVTYHQKNNQGSMVDHASLEKAGL